MRVGIKDAIIVERNLDMGLNGQPYLSNKIKHTRRKTNGVIYNNSSDSNKFMVIKFEYC